MFAQQLYSLCGGQRVNKMEQINQFICSWPSWLVYVTTVTLSTLAISLSWVYLPDRIEFFSKESVFEDALRNSITLKIFEGICVGSTFPMLLDILLDQFSNVRHSTTDITQRTIWLIALSSFSILYIACSNFFFMPFLYVFLLRSRLLLLGSLTFYYISNGRIISGWKINKVIVAMPVIGCGLYNAFDLYSLLIPENKILNDVVMVILVLTLVAFLVVESIWFYYLRQEYLKFKCLSNEVVTEIMYMATMLVYLAASQIVRAIFGIKSWFESGEQPLICNAVIQLLMILLAAVLPGRLVRIIAAVSIKKIFNCNIT